MFTFFIIISLFLNIFSYNNTSLQLFRQLKLKIKNSAPYRLKFSSGGIISLSFPKLYNSNSLGSKNESDNSFILLNNKGEYFDSPLKYYNFSSVMGYTLDKNDIYYILEQGKIFDNSTVEKNTTKLIIYSANNGKITDINFEGINLNNNILTDIAVDHQGKYAYIIDSGNLNDGDSIPGIIVLNLEDKKKIYKILNNHKSFKDFDIPKSRKINDIFDIIGINNIQISCNDETIYYSSSKKNISYSISTSDILKAIKKFENSKDENNLNSITVNSVVTNFKSENFILSSKGNIFMINSDSKNIEVSFNINDDLSSINFELNSIINSNDSIKINKLCSLDIYDGKLYLLVNDKNGKNLPNIYYAELKKDELNSNIGCTVFFFKADIFVIILFALFLIILVISIILIIEKNGSKLEKSNLIQQKEKEEAINELNRELNEED